MPKQKQFDFEDHINSLKIKTKQEFNEWAIHEEEKLLMQLRIAEKLSYNK